MSELAPLIDIQPPDDVAAADGRVAAIGQPELTVPILEVPSGFESEEIAVLSLISKGNTAVQIARLLGPEFDMDRDDVNMHRTNVMDKLNTGSIAQAVHRAIKGGILPIEAKPDETVLAGLRNHDVYTLRRYTRGVSNHQLAEESQQPVKVLEAFHDRLLERLGAWSRPHAVRRGHELEILS